MTTKPRQFGALPNVAARVFNAPLLIDGAKLDTMLAALGPRVLEGRELEPMTGEPRRGAYRSGEPREYQGGGYLDPLGIAVLPVMGTLVRRSSWLDACMGVTSYAALQDSLVEMMADPSARGVMLEIDTYGGEAGGVFDLVDFMRTASAQWGKPIWAHANESALSAGYAIASGADRIWVTRTGEVGSVGVVAAHVDVSEADKLAGHKWTYIYAGKHKIDGNPHAPLPSSVKARIQADIDELYGMFVDQVAANRRMTADAVRATEADIFMGAKAVEVGFADAVGTFDDAMQAFAESLEATPVTGRRAASVAEQRRAVMAGKSKIETKDTPSVTDDVEETKTTDTPAVTDKQDDATASAAAAAAAKTAGADQVTAAAATLEAERVRTAALVGVGEKAAKLGVKFDLAKAIKDGVTAEAAGLAVLEEAAKMDGARETATAGADPAKTAHGGASPWGAVLERQRARASRG